jgi:hypothetical protein
MKIMKPVKTMKGKRGPLEEFFFMSFTGFMIFMFEGVR